VLKKGAEGMDQKQGGQERGAQESIAASATVLALSVAMRRFSRQAGLGSGFVADWNQAERGAEIGVRIGHAEAEEHQAREWAKILLRAERVIFLQKHLFELRAAHQAGLADRELVEQAQRNLLEAAIELNPEDEAGLREAALRAPQGS
jgi:hypothetical protein